MRRRQAWGAFGAVAIAAAAAGVGWRLRRHDSDANGDGDAPPLDARDLRRLRAPRPEGGELALADFAGHPLVVNFWATWCAPCVEELPLLDRFHRSVRGRGWQVLGLAVDREAPVRAFLALHPVAFPVALIGADGVAWTRALGNASGALPFSVLLDAAGNVVARRLGRVDDALLAGWLREHG